MQQDTEALGACASCELSSAPTGAVTLAKFPEPSESRVPLLWGANGDSHSTRRCSVWEPSNARSWRCSHGVSAGHNCASPGDTWPSADVTVTPGGGGTMAPSE